MQALQRLPPTVERDQQELSLMMILGVAVMAIKGFAADEARDVFESVLELVRRHGTPSQAFRAQWLLALFYYFRAELESAEKIGRQLLMLADTSGESFFVLEAHRGVGSVLLELGRFDDALEHLEHSSGSGDVSPRESDESLSGQTPQVVNACYAARATWALGYPDTALDRAERALSAAQDVRHPERLLIATHFAAQLNQLRGEHAATQERAETVISLAEEYGLPLWLAFGHMNRGWARIAQSDVDGGIEELRRGLSMYDASGARLWRPHYLGLLAQALAGAEHIDDALTEVSSALAMVDGTGEYWCAAELHRIEGELVIMQAGGDDRPSTPPQKLPSAAASRAEDCFRQALAIAAQAAGAVVGIESQHESGAPLSQAGQARRGASSCPRGSRLVQRGTRHGRPEDGPDSRERMARDGAHASLTALPARARVTETSPRHDHHVMTRGLDARYSGLAIRDCTVQLLSREDFDGESSSCRT